MNFGPVGIGDWSVQISITAIVMFVIMIGIWYGIFIHTIVRIIQRTGRSGWAVLWLFVPVANIIALQFFAYGHWPALDRDRTQD